MLRGLGRGKRPQEVSGSGGSSKEQQEPGGLQVRKMISRR
jgi:hypothetical protein